MRLYFEIFFRHHFHACADDHEQAAMLMFAIGSLLSWQELFPFDPEYKQSDSFYIVFKINDIRM